MMFYEAGRKGKEKKLIAHSLKCCWWEIQLAVEQLQGIYSHLDSMIDDPERKSFYLSQYDHTVYHE